LRKRRVWRYAILYFLMLIIFLVLFAGPIVLNNTGVAQNLFGNLNETIPMHLIQPTKQDNNDTTTDVTGTAAQTSAIVTGAARLVKLF
jgi:1,3-beta-glucan synthase